LKVGFEYGVSGSRKALVFTNLKNLQHPSYLHSAPQLNPRQFNHGNSKGFRVISLSQVAMTLNPIYTVFVCRFQANPQDFGFRASDWQFDRWVSWFSFFFNLHD
jgi:hypothetical protein